MAGCPYLHIGGLRARSGDAVVTLNGTRLRVVHDSKGRSRLNRPSFFPPSDGEITLRDLRTALDKAGVSEIEAVVFTQHGSFATPLDPSNSQGRKGREQDAFATLCSLDPAARRAAALYQLSTLPDSNKASTEATRSRVRAIERFVSMEEILAHADSRYGDHASEEMVRRIVSASGASPLAKARIVGHRCSAEQLDSLLGERQHDDDAGGAELVEALAAHLDTTQLMRLALDRPLAALASPTAVKRLDPTTLELVKRRNLGFDSFASMLPYSLPDVSMFLEDRAPEISELRKYQRAAPGVYSEDEIRELQQQVIARATDPESGAYATEIFEQTAEGRISGVIEQIPQDALDAMLDQQVQALTSLGKRNSPRPERMEHHIGNSLDRLAAAVEVQHLLTPQWREFLQERFPEKFDAAILRQFCEDSSATATDDIKARAAANPVALFTNEKLVSIFSTEEIRTLARAHPDIALEHAPGVLPQDDLLALADNNPARVLEVLGGALPVEQRKLLAEKLPFAQRAALAPDTIDFHNLVLDVVETKFEDPRSFLRLLDTAPDLFTAEQLQLLHLTRQIPEAQIAVVEGRRAEITAAAKRKNS